MLQGLWGKCVYHKHTSFIFLTISVRDSFLETCSGSQKIIHIFTQTLCYRGTIQINNEIQDQTLSRFSYISCDGDTPRYSRVVLFLLTDRLDEHTRRSEKAMVHAEGSFLSISTCTINFGIRSYITYPDTLMITSDMALVVLLPVLAATIHSHIPSPP
jgi:hypothetical protein